MADEIYRMEDLYAEDIADNINEVRTARGEYDSLGERLDDIESGSFAPTPEQQAALDSGITADIVSADTAALIELVDGGAKNKLNHTAYTRTVNGVTYTVNADRSITITSDGTNTQSLLYLVQNYELPAGDYVLSGCPEGSSTTFDLRVKAGSTTYTNYEGGTEFTYNGTDALESTIVVRAAQTLNITMKPMICTKTEWGVSQSYQPYRPSYQELYEMVLALQGGN